MTTTTYTFEAAAAPYEFHDSKVHHRNGTRHRRGRTGSSSSINTGDLGQDGSGGDHNSCSGSLTYSATSSVNSGCADSTDSSFADIMKVLDAHDGKDLASFLRGGGGGSSRRLLNARGGDERSVEGESLAYSTDADTYLRSLATEGESHLRGADFLSQANSTQHEYTNHSTEDDHVGAPGTNDDAGDDPFADNIFFAPAEHTESIKQRKERKRLERLQRKAEKDQQRKNPMSGGSSHASSSSRGGGAASASSHGGRRTKGNGGSFESMDSDLPEPTQLESRQGTPPALSLPPRGIADAHPHHFRNHTRPPKSRSNSSSGGGSHYSSTRFRDRGGDDEADYYADSRDGPAQGSNYRGSHGKRDHRGYPSKSFADYTLRECGEDVWYYAKWWLFCFPDAVKNMTERR